ncbi:MAG: 4-hydroxythreonine-4-phosphate dehydrogenase PdxA [Planctomycetaceae bacterium]|nr:4-hydroxythreonine-4-phosphate dehydrogenase PdxA [Planctomycetaceae bacterium]
MTDSPLPRLAITLGDVAGIGPEVVVRSLADENVRSCCQPVIIGDEQILQRTADRLGLTHALDGIDNVHVTVPGLIDVPLGIVDARAGAAAFDCLSTTIDMALDGSVDGIVTAPLSKYALHLAGHDYPGHTEILAERCGVSEFAMMLYVPPSDIVRSPHGLAVAHTTLHTSIASVPRLLSKDRIADTIELTHNFLRRVGCDSPRIGVCALNPHAGENGLFGNEEASIIAPAVESARQHNINANGPAPADTLIKRAVDGEFDGIVAMYHDQGHIALKLIAFGHAVNVTLGLPITRTSPSHGTAFDIAARFEADPTGMIEAIRVAAQLCQST